MANTFKISYPTPLPPQINQDDALGWRLVVQEFRRIIALTNPLSPEFSLFMFNKARGRKGEIPSALLKQLGGGGEEVEGQPHNRAQTHWQGQRRPPLEGMWRRQEGDQVRVP